MSTLLFFAGNAAPNSGLAAAFLDLMMARIRTSPLLGAPKSLLAWAQAIWTEWASPARGGSRRRAGHCDGAMRPRIFAFRRCRRARCSPGLHALSGAK